MRTLQFGQPRRKNSKISILLSELNGRLLASFQMKYYAIKLLQVFHQIIFRKKKLQETLTVKNKVQSEIKLHNQNLGDISRYKKYC